jgi:hypothetical protein
MPTFRSVNDLEQSLEAAGLEAHSRDIAATLRPVVLFLRQQVPDESLPVGISKVGGDPDLPEEFDWPERQPPPDALRRAQAIEQRGLTTARRLEEMPDSPFSPDEIEQIIDKHRSKAATLHLTMPLAFVAQLDLGTLSRQAGFPTEFPATGLLSIFSDATTPALAVHWHDRPASDLSRRGWPQDLIDYFDRYNERADWPDDEGKWDNNAKAEALTAFSALAVPHHWKSAFAQSSPTGRRIRNWFDDAHRVGGFFPTAEMADHGPSAANFGDRLGGWPADIQGHAESGIGGSVAMPGVTPWRQIFSWGAERYQGTRAVATEAGDGARYVLMHEEDLRARRFDKVRNTYQQT